MKLQTGNNGFTLFELIVVLAIISAMATIIVPYANRTNNSLKIKQQALNIVETTKYAIDLARNTQQPVRLIINRKNKSYRLERYGEAEEFKAVEGYYGMVRYLAKNIFISDIEGFSGNADKWSLIFEADKGWPRASLCICNKDILEKILINRKQVTIQETSI